MVESVVRFPLQLETCSLTDPEDLHQRQIDMKQTWASQNVSARITEHIGCWDAEGGWVEPEIPVLVGDVGRSNDIWSERAAIRIQGS
jgi:hypothetical protein